MSAASPLSPETPLVSPLSGDSWGDLYYDWNVDREFESAELHDETLRDGLQSPSVTIPTIEEKLKILELVDQFGVESSDLGFPSSGVKAYDDCRTLVESIREKKLAIKPVVAGRTMPHDVDKCVKLFQETHVEGEMMAFLGSSPVRIKVENWDVKKMEGGVRDTVRRLVSGGVAANFVTEDTIRSKSSVLRRLFTAAIEEGAIGLVLCDTVGHATPTGTRRLVKWTKDLIEELELDRPIRLDWHAHNDRGLALANTLAAFDAGVHRGHGTVLGIGERVGNTSLDQLIVNMFLLNQDRNSRQRRPSNFLETSNLSNLGQLVDLVSRSTKTDIAHDYPVFGRDAFLTGTGVHAAAIKKALSTGNETFADSVYSAVPARIFGIKQRIAIGPQSGESNVTFFLDDHDISTSPELVHAILDTAKAKFKLLEDEEVLDVVKQFE